MLNVSEKDRLSLRTSDPINYPANERKHPSHEFNRQGVRKFEPQLQLPRENRKLRTRRAPYIPGVVAYKNLQIEATASFVELVSRPT